MKMVVMEVAVMKFAMKAAVRNAAVKTTALRSATMEAPVHRLGSASSGEQPYGKHKRGGKPAEGLREAGRDGAEHGGHPYPHTWATRRAATTTWNACPSWENHMAVCGDTQRGAAKRKSRAKASTFPLRWAYAAMTVPFISP